MRSIHLVKIHSGVREIGETIMFATENEELANTWAAKYNRIVNNHTERISKAMESDNSICPYTGDFIYYEKLMALVQTVELR